MCYFILHSLHKLKINKKKKKREREKNTRKTRGRIIPWQLRVDSGAYGDIEGNHEKHGANTKLNVQANIEHNNVFELSILKYRIDALGELLV